MEAERSLVVFSLADQRYALALAYVQRSIRVVAITPLPEAPAIVLGIIDLGGVVIPAIDPPVETEQPRALSPASVRGTETVLLVEDDAAIRTLLRDVLRGNGYIVLEAPDASAGFDVAAEFPGPIHLLVTDVVMPGMNGRQLADQLTAQRPELKVLFISGYPHDTILQHGVLVLGISFLQKPFTPGLLACKVREILDTP